ncbi:MAG: response regulator transcription factor [Firmicutes bacterium]|jgi:two-component system response regulator ResD|nr:response regulator transcription factor [Bacillota bacterium]
MNQHTILIIENQLSSEQLISIILKREGYLVLQSGNRTEALRLLNLKLIDIVLIGTNLPKNDSWTIFNTIKQKFDIPVIFINDENTKLLTLPTFYFDADDFITKPFTPKELLSRVYLSINRHKKVKNDYAIQNCKEPLISVGPYSLNSMAREFFFNGNLQKLTPREHDLLEHFMLNQNIVFSRNQLLEDVWGFEYSGDSRTVDTHIKKLRNKIDPDSQFIVTVWGKGYKFKTR